MGRLELFEAPEISEQDFFFWGHVLCVAPHPDDEALGCGGALARLASRNGGDGPRTGIVWVSDGAGSHPNSIEYAAPKLAQLREREAREAAAQLGVRDENLFFMGLPDGALPFPGDEQFNRALALAMNVLDQFAPNTILLPWRRDPHRDHRATWAIWTTALQLWRPIRTFEYLVWAFERAAQDEWPDDSEASAIRVSIQGFEKIKRAAIDAHASQTTHLITDDPSGFWLSPEVIAHFETPFEAFIAPFTSLPDQMETQRPAFER